MPQRKAAKKELKKDLKKRALNLARKRAIKEAIKKYKKSLQNKELAEAQKALKEVYKTLDKAVLKRTIHPNKAKRKKSRCASLLNKIKSQ